MKGTAHIATTLLVCTLVACSDRAGDAPAAEQGTPSSAATPSAGPGASPSAPVAAEAVYVDVRTPAEFAAGHVPGALNIPVEEIEQRWHELEQYRDRPMVLYCRSGRRSGIALDVLRSHGFTHLENGVNMQTLARRVTTPSHTSAPGSALPATQ